MSKAKKLSTAAFTTSCIVSANDSLSRADCTVRSRYNTTSAPARIAPAILNALYYLLASIDPINEHQVGIAINEERGEIILEKTSHKVDGRKDVVLFNYSTSTVMVCQVDENGNIFSENPSTNSIMMLHLVNLIRIDCDIATAFENSKQYAKRIIQKDDDTSLIFDAGYYAIESTFQNVEVDNIPFLDASYTEGYVDITSEILGHNGKFWFANIVEPVANVSSAKIKKGVSIADLRNHDNFGEHPILVAYRKGLTPEQNASIPDANDAELANYVVSDGFIENLSLLMDSIENNYMHGKSVFLYGVPGSGKSSEPRAVASALGIPYEYFQFSRETSQDQLIGGPIPVDGGGLTMFTDTSLKKCFESGGILSLEDITYGVTGNTALFNSILESPFMYIDASGNPVKRHPLCIIYATANLDCAGANELLAALDSRFYINEKRDILDDDDLAKVIINRSGNPNKSEIKTIIDCYHMTCKLIGDTYGYDAPMPTMRNLIFWARQSTLLGGLLPAAKKNFLGALKFDEEFVNKVYTTIMSKCPAVKKK